MSRSTIAEAAQSGFAPAAEYDAHRPSYPKAAVEQLLQNLEVSGVNGAKVADLAAGTGKFTEILAKRPEQYEIVAIEPHDGMRGQLERKQLPRVRVVKGMADSMSDIPDQSLDALVAAQVSRKDDMMEESQSSDQLRSHFIGTLWICCLLSGYAV